jgi:peroxiredoxin
VAELQGLQLSMADFRRRGAQVVGVVVDPVQTNAELARTAELEFPILSDPDLRTTDAYGLRHRDGHDGHDIALSASILIDAQGIVRWTHVARNLRVRPLPADVLAAINALPTSP